MDLEIGLEGPAILGAQKAAAPVILMDTSALVWLLSGHRRSRPLAKWLGRLYVSPVSLLEVQFLIEAQRIRVKSGFAAPDLMSDPRWLIDDPPSVAWFETALNITWTRDPFDRLIFAHSRYRGWRLATADAEMLSHLGPRQVFEL